MGFWRYSTEGLTVLFSAPLGYEVIGCAYDTPARLHPDNRRPELIHPPFEPAWIGVAVLARKTADVDEKRFRWSTTLANTLGDKSRYPPPT